MPLGRGIEAETTGRRGGEGGGRNFNHRLQDTPNPSLILQLPWEIPVGVGRRLAGGGAQHTEGAAEVGAPAQGFGKRGRRCLDLGKDLHGGGPGSLAVWVGDVVNDTTNWEGFERISPQGGPQDNETANPDRDFQYVGVTPAGGGDGRDGVTGGGDLHILPPEHSLTVHCNHAYHGPMSGRGEASGVTDVQGVVVSRRPGLVEDTDDGSGGGTGVGEGGDRQDEYRDTQIMRWEDTLANVILGTEPNSTLDYDLGLQLHHPIMSMLGGHRGRLERERYGCLR